MQILLHRFENAVYVTLRIDHLLLFLRVEHVVCTVALREFHQLLLIASLRYRESNTGQLRFQFEGEKNLL